LATAGQTKGGAGRFVFKDGSVYVGEWQVFDDDGRKKRHGLGRFYPAPPAAAAAASADASGADGSATVGEFYVGEWREDFIHGRGKYSFSSASWYEGEWEFGKFHGRGTYVWRNGASYVGDW
jgi:hypothetical protein